MSEIITEQSNSSSISIRDIISNASKSFMKVKDSGGNYNVVLPITKLSSVLDANGKTLETYIMETSSSIAKANNDIGILFDDTDYLYGLYSELKDNDVTPMKLKIDEHLEVFDDNEENVFNQLYNELDGLSESVKSINDTLLKITESINLINSKLESSITVQSELSKKIDDVNKSLSGHIDEIDMSLLNSQS